MTAARQEQQEEERARRQARARAAQARGEGGVKLEEDAEGGSSSQRPLAGLQLVLVGAWVAPSTCLPACLPACMPWLLQPAGGVLLP